MNTLSDISSSTVFDTVLEKVNIEVLPETADNRSYTVRPVANDAISFPDFIASTAGIYTWEVVSDQNPEVKTNITVNVLTPVSFTVPESIELLGFDSMDYNVVYAQMGRGKMERNVGFAIATIAGTLAKMAFDACMFNSQNFSFVKLPKECTTGSSIMPHKKNPDVFELIRAKSNKLQSLPQQITLIMNNLPVGYFRDLQIIKEVFLPAFDELKDCLQMAAYIINKIEVNEHILDNPMYDPIFSVEEVNRLAAAGMPFRDAYKKVGLDIEAGKFTPNKNIHHTHEGSIGNLMNDEIVKLMNDTIEGFNFNRMIEAEKKLVEN